MCFNEKLQWGCTAAAAAADAAAAAAAAANCSKAVTGESEHDVRRVMMMATAGCDGDL
jgi:hypothetical protein